MQEQANERTIAITVNGAKLTARMLLKVFRELEKLLKNTAKTGGKLTVAGAKGVVNNVLYKGKQNLKSLSKSGETLADVEISSDNIKGFDKYARKYGIDYSLKKSVALDGETKSHTVFFKVKNTSILQQATKEYTRDLSLNNTRKPFKAKMKNLKTKVRSPLGKMKNKSKGLEL